MGRYGDEIAGLSAPLTGPGDLDVLLARIGDARVVMIGEASHGTHEYYGWRAALMRRLITERGFTSVAVEGDWPDCERVDRSVRTEPDAPDAPRDARAQFARRPTCMWVPPAHDGSLAAVLHHAAPARAVFAWPASRPSLLTGHLDHRAIGVVYHPERERWGNYVPTVLGDRYDAFLWFDETSALRPLAQLRRTPS